MKSTCKVIGSWGILGMVLLATPTTSVNAQQTMDSSSMSQMAIDTGGYSDSLVRPGYRALLEDTTVTSAGESDGDSNPTTLPGDTAGGTGVSGGGGMDTTAMPRRREEP
jgi:hypothetical protein